MCAINTIIIFFVVVDVINKTIDFMDNEIYWKSVYLYNTFWNNMCIFYYG